jgi:ketosteroid isomerase-like protein
MDEILRILGKWGILSLIYVIIGLCVLAYIIAKPNNVVKLGFISFTKDEIQGKITKVQKIIIVIVAIIVGCIPIYFYIPFYFPISSVPISDRPYQIRADEEIMTRLIEAEAKAVNNRDICIIRNIFTSDAIIEDVINQRRWTDPVAHYESTFQELSYTNAINYSIKQTSNVRDEVTYTSASRGRFINNKNHIPGEYNNPPGSNEWVFKKDSDGCWRIIRFRYNIPQ